jgi:outer membrane receptor protein involved in Fe transport
MSRPERSAGVRVATLYCAENHRLPLLGCLLAALLGAELATAASTEANLAGKVTDKSGQPLPGVTLVLKNDALAFKERGTLSDSQGEYRFSHVPPGEGYRLTVSLTGYSTLIFSDIRLDSGRTQQQSVVLHSSGDLKEVVRVQGKSDTLDTENVTASTTFSSTFISELPILGRDYQDILSLAPGVTDVDKTGNPNIHGARDTDVVTLVDGVSTTDPFTGYYGQNLNIESIQELEVITSAATAQYSRAQGGFANILTKSGGNEFQGTFKFYLRSDRLDRDGAGVEDPELSGGFQGNRSFTEQHFTDLMPFLSLSGAIVRDRLWYYLTFEYIHEETPVNAVSQAYVTSLYGNRVFAKATWQIQPSHRLAFSLILDKERRENQGISSLIHAKSGYTSSRGGPTYTLKGSSVFTPTVLLESTVAWFDNSFSQTPTMNPDTNGNGILFVDDRPELGGNGNGVLDAQERDPGEDWDFDGFYDLFEDVNHNAGRDFGEDQDLDDEVSGSIEAASGSGTGSYLNVACDGYHHEDRNCNGYLDAEIDENLNGRLDPEEDGIDCNREWGYCPGGILPGTGNNQRWDTEDVNGNGVLDVLGDSGYTSTPFWNDANGNGRPDKGEFRAPLPPDQDLLTDSEGRTYGPSAYSADDHRQRLSWVEDLSLFVDNAVGTHDIKLGSVYEHEAFDSDTFLRPRFRFPDAGFSPGHTLGSASSGMAPGRVRASLGVPAFVNNTVTGDNLGIYFQDTWKPMPNLTIGLGLRYDSEYLQSFGYSHFDPVAERRKYNAVMDASGLDLNLNDNITTSGLCRDPIHSCLGSQDPPLQDMYSQMRSAAFGLMTRHNLDAHVLSSFLGLVTGGGDINAILAQGLHARRPEDFDVSNSNLAPRLSLSWDPWADGKTQVIGSWGRYYDKLFLSTMSLEQGPDTVTRTYRVDLDGVDDQGLPDNRIGKPFSQSSLSAFQVDRSLSTPYSVEWTAGFRRELAPEVLVSFRYISRDYHDQLQDIDINHRTEIDPHTGKLADHHGEVQCTSRACTNAPNGAPDLYIENFYFNRVYRLGNFNEQTYRGWEIEFVRRLKRKWQMEASYTYSVAQGDAESFLSQIGDDPALAEFEPGYLNYDQRHVIKLNAVAFLPGDWRLGGTITWASGLPFSGIVYYDDSDDVGFVQNRLLFGQLGNGGYGINPENRNIHRNAATYILNTRVMKSFVIGKASASAFLEVYNLLNSDSLRVDQLDQIPAQASFGASGPAIITPAVISLTGERDFGRRFQIGFQVDF